MQLVYLNNAASGWPKAPGVIEAITQSLSRPPSAADLPDDPLAQCRIRLARFLSVDDPECVILTTGATQALNAAVLGIGLEGGVRVVTTVTEHDSVLRPLNHLENSGHIRLTIVGLDETGAPDRDALEHQIALGARLVAINHVSNVTGRVCDVRPIFEKAKAAGAVTLLDASQSVGRIPVLPQELCADLVAITGHKGIHGPSGTGALYVAPGISLERALVGGTPNTPAFAGLAVATEWTEHHGAEFRSRSREMGRLLWSRLRETPEVRLYSSVEDAVSSGIVSFSVSGWTAEDAGAVLQESHGISCHAGQHCAPLIHRAIGSAPEGTIRFSVSGFNSAADIEHAADAVRSLASGADLALAA